MAETAVGLFQHESNADLILDALRRDGFASDAIRVVSMPLGLSVDSSTSTPGIDFAAALAKDLQSMGASDGETEHYVSSVQSGGVLLFVTGTQVEADRAAALMNERGASQIEEFAGVAPSMPVIHAGDPAPHAISLKEDRVRANTAGARVFTW